MRGDRFAPLAAALLVALLVDACGGSPVAPPPPPPPPVNAMPVIDDITVRGRRADEPERFADLRESVDVSAVVRDSETAVDELTYAWSASAGTFTGTGRTVTWTAPDSAPTPASVAITLTVTERYGRPGEAKNFSQQVTGTQTIALHDSAGEIAAMAHRFLTEFSQPQANKNANDIMRDFKPSACPQPGLVDAERDEVTRHYTFFTMNTYTIQNPDVRIAFRAGCAFRDRPGDACASTRVFWDSTDTRTGGREIAQGIDYIAAAFSRTDNRWWLCSSDFEPAGSLTASSFYSR
jgi:hypothetical protein